MINIHDIVGTIIRGEQAIKFPLKKPFGGWISDANDNHILDMRGWGYLQYHSEGQEAAAKLQDDIAEWVVQTLNEEAKRQGIYHA